ncbi:hypothetical protein IJJ08_00005 [bacterium]|nr:hypothetical protein [bacterium]
MKEPRRHSTTLTILSVAQLVAKCKGQFWGAANFSQEKLATVASRRRLQAATKVAPQAGTLATEK